ncbi:MAG: Ig-like domain-containing protein [Lachnospiraceae bacterium]|nr:Ig-like domain-containing protein [Lachnospiraceae bacterium]
MGYFPVKVSYKKSAKKNAKTYTKKLYATAKTVNAGARFTSENPATVLVGGTTTTALKVCPTAAKATYTSSDEKIATVDANGVITGVAAGEATITATTNYGKVATVKVSVKKVALKDVKQTKANELVATIAGDTKSLKNADISIKTPDNVVLPVKTLAIDSKDATQVTLTTFTDMKDSKEYSVTLDGVTKTFVATDGKVASIGLDKVTIPVKTETEIKLVAKDSNGVVLKELAYGSSDVNYDFSITTTNGYTKGSKLYLNKVGDTATAKITYKTNKYTTDGKPDGNIGPNEVTITSTEQSAVSSFKVRIGEANKKYSTLKDNDKIAVDETKAVWAYFEIKNADGKEIDNYGDYRLESSDKATLMLVGDTMGTNHKIKLVPAKEGVAYIFVKKDDKIVSSVPVTVVAARKVTTMTADKTGFSVSNTVGAANVVVTLAVKDQYGNDFNYVDGTDGAIDVTCEGAPSGVTKENVTVPAFDSKSGNKVKYVVTGSNYITKGTYTFKFTFKKDGKEVCAQVITVNVEKAGDAGSSVSYKLNILNSNGATQTEEDAVVNADNTSARQLTVSVAELLKGVEAKQVTVGNKIDDNADSAQQSTVKKIYYKVTNQKGDVVFNNEPGSVKTNGAINAGNSTVSDTLTIDVVKTGSAVNHYNKFEKGTYNVTATVVIDPKSANAGDDTKWTKTIIATAFTITDSSNDEITDMKLKDEKVDQVSIQAALASVIQFSYDGKKYGADGDYTADIVSIEGYSNVVGGNGKITADNMSTALTSGKTADITKVTVRVQFLDDNGAVVGTVDQTVNVTFSITAK